MMSSEVRGFYRHWKGGVYFIHGVAVHGSAAGVADGAIEFIVYESIQSADDDRMRIRSAGEFFENVRDIDGHTVPRFVRVESW